MQKSGKIGLVAGLLILILCVGAYAAGVRLALFPEAINPAPYLEKPRPIVR